MPLEDPVNVYIASTNEQAFLIKQRFETEGIRAEVTEDLSTVGFSWFGPISGINRPQIWVSRGDVEAAVRLLAEFEILNRDRNTRQADDDSRGIEVVCDDCGQISIFSAALNGSVQVCTHCAAFVDVDDAANTFEADNASDDSSKQE